MSSAPLGAPTSAIEVTNVSAHGLWILVGEEEFFLAFDDFPWFRDAPIGKIIHITEPSPGHYYWPDLDIDIGLETIRHPDRFPLVAR